MPVKGALVEGQDCGQLGPSHRTLSVTEVFKHDCCPRTFSDSAWFCSQLLGAKVASQRLWDQTKGTRHRPQTPGLKSPRDLVCLAAAFCPQLTPCLAMPAFFLSFEHTKPSTSSEPLPLLLPLSRMIVPPDICIF